jgi:phage N-6-adenine-methyltransferase
MIVPKQPYTLNEHGVRSNDIRCTPPALVEICRKLVDVDRFTLDVAASPGNAICEDYYALERGQDGLEIPWYGHVWCNPPYSDIGSWVRKAWIEHSGLRTASITMLIPANRTDQKWWHDYVESAGYAELRRPFLRGRHKFQNADGSPIYAKKKDGSIKTTKAGKPVIGSPSFGLCVLHWRGDAG